MTQLETYINELTEAGFILFPLNANRLPTRKGWNKTAPGEWSNDILAQAPAIGIMLQDDALVLDYDPRREVIANENQLAKLFQELKIETPIETYIVATGGVYDQGQGYHVYFKKPPDFPVRGSTIPGYPAVEIKTKGRYVVAAGSLHEHGKRYAVKRGNPRNILVAPEALLAVCEKPASANDSATNNASTQSDTPQSRQRFIDYIANGGHQQTAYVLAAYGKDLGLSEDSITAILFTEANKYWTDQITESEARERAVHAFQYGQNAQGCKSISAAQDYSDIPELKERQEAAEPQNSNDFITFTGYDIQVDKHGNKVLLPTLRNAIAHLILPEYHNVLGVKVANPLYKLLRYNLFSHQIEFLRPAPWHDVYERASVWTDSDTVMLKTWWMQHTALYNVESRIIEDAIVAVSHGQHYHPVREWLMTLKWDGIPRLNTWLIDYAGADDNDYVREVGRLTFIAAIARVFKPGIKHDTMLILEGKQDLGKSRLVKAIGGKWYADVQIDPHSKDCVDAMQGAWILEASELEFMRRNDVNALKRFLSLQEDKVRLAYARRAKPFPRQSIFIGTVNPTPEGYLHDSTGNRRYLPVLCRRINVEGFKNVRDQIFAEAYARFQNGEKHYTTDVYLKNLFILEQKGREAYYEWSQTLNIWYEDCKDLLPRPLTTEAIMSSCFNIPRSKQNNRFLITEVQRAIRDAGFRQAHRYSKRYGRSIRAWEKVNEEFAGLDDL